MQLEDEAFTAWMQRLTEARRNRENKVQRPYRNFCKPYNNKYVPSKESGRDRYGKYQIKQKFKPVAEIDVQLIMDAKVDDNIHLKSLNIIPLHYLYNKHKQ